MIASVIFEDSFLYNAYSYRHQLQYILKSFYCLPEICKYFNVQRLAQVHSNVVSENNAMQGIALFSAFI